MKKGIFFQVVFLLIFLFTLNFVFSGEYTNSYFEGRLMECQDLTDSWNLRANLIMGISIMVGILGIVIGLFQKLNFKGVKPTIMTLGALVSILTFMHSTAFDADRKSFKKWAIQGKTLTREINKRLATDTVGYSLEDIKVFESEIQDLLDKFTNIELKIINEPITFNVNLFPAAYAQSMQEIEQKPVWTTTTPQSEQFLFFVSKAENKHLSEAKESAVHEARTMAQQYLSSELFRAELSDNPDEMYQIAEKIAWAGEDAKTYFYRNPETELFEYYVLYALNKNLFESELAKLAVKQQINYEQVKELKFKLDKVESPEQNYYLERKNVYDNLFKEAQQELGPEAYEVFSRARLRRQKGELQEAAFILDSLVNIYPDFFMGWYNLALCYDNLEMPEKANNAYLRAVETEPLQSERDASIYNTYGYFLYRQKDFENAIPMFEKALDINPGHPKAKKNLDASHSFIKMQ